MVKPCWKPHVDDDGPHRGGNGNGRVDGLLWYKDLGHHAYGQFSMAVVQANTLLEDQSELESGSLSLNNSGPPGTFIGVYDGHGGSQAARFVNDNLFSNLKRFASMYQGISENVIRKAFAATEEGFLSLVQKQWFSKPQIASAGSCCLVGIISDGLIYIANVGDSRVVLGRTERATKEVIAIQLSTEHNAGLESVRDELRFNHPRDPQIVTRKHNVWRVKGIIQVSRSIGDAYLKRSEFNREPLQPKFRLPEPFDEPILSSEPSISVQKICSEDRFLIFASDGLWEHLSNQKAVDIVDNYPHNGIARRLVKAALQEAAKKREMRYTDLKRVDRGVRRHFHDDITVVVVFLDAHLLDGTSYSIRGGEGLASSENA